MLLGDKCPRKEDCRRKWRGIRDWYQSEQGREVWVSSFRPAAYLSFLDPFIVPRATSGNFTARPSTSSI
ncbi:unnamed protein product, partial [Coregonus sp. 'balchen']